MTAPRRRMPGKLLAGSLLVVAGLAFWALFVKESAVEPHAYSRAGAPPAYVRVVAGHTYRIAIRGGVDRETRLGMDPAALSCTATRPGQGPGVLALTTETADTKATNDIASFVAAFTGEVHIECARLGTVYVDDAAGSPFDWSGVWLVLTSAALLVGAPLILSVLRGASGAGAADDGPERLRADDAAAEEVL